MNTFSEVFNYSSIFVYVLNETGTYFGKLIIALEYYEFKLFYFRQ